MEKKDKVFYKGNVVKFPNGNIEVVIGFDTVNGKRFMETIPLNYSNCSIYHYEENLIKEVYVEELSAYMKEIFSHSYNEAELVASTIKEFMIETVFKGII